MATGFNITLSDEIQQTIEEIAREQNRQPVDVLEEAIRRYAALRSLERLAVAGEVRVRSLGIREEDIPKLVDELRQENRERGS